MNQNEALEDFVDGYINTLQNKNTLRAYSRVWNEIFLFASGEKITTSLLRAFTTYMVECDMSSASIAQAVNAINHVCRVINNEFNGDFGTVKWKHSKQGLNLKLVPKSVRHDVLSQIEQRVCYSEIDKYIKYRDLLIYWLFAHGLRREETTKVRWCDIVQGSNGVTVAIRGKGNDKNRTIIASPQLSVAISTVRSQGAVIGVDSVENSLRQVLLNRELAPLTHNGVYFLFNKWFTSEYSPHDMRATTCTELLERGYNLLDVCSWFGWESPETAKRYDLSQIKKMAAIAADLGGW